jgi:hypothetical protein
MITALWLILTVVLAALAFSGWVLVRALEKTLAANEAELEQATHEVRDLRGRLAYATKPMLEASSDSLYHKGEVRKRDDEIRELKCTVAKLRWRLKLKWREERGTGNWGKYFAREREIREKASTS